MRLEWVSFFVLAGIARNSPYFYQQEQERVKWEEQRTSQREMGNQQAEIKRYEDELARHRMKSEHELQRQRNGELVKMQEESARAQEQERLRIEQQIQAERRAAEQYKVCIV